MLRKFKHRGDSIIGQLRLPDLQRQQNVCDGRIMTSEEQDFGFELPLAFFFPIVDTFLDERPTFEFLQFVVVGIKNETRVRQWPQFVGVISSTPFRQL